MIKGNNLDNKEHTNKLNMPLRKEAQVLHRLKKKQKRSKLCKTNKNNNKNNHKYSTLEILVLLFHKLKKANHR